MDSRRCRWPLSWVRVLTPLGADLPPPRPTSPREAPTTPGLRPSRSGSSDPRSRHRPERWLLVVAVSAWCLVSAVPGSAGAATYYFSTSGGDNQDGLSPDRPRKSIAGIPALVDGGNRALLRRGDVWTSSRFQWNFENRSGTRTSPMFIGAYGDTALPRPIVADMVRNLRSEWKTKRGKKNVYYVSVYGTSTPNADAVKRVYLGGLPIPRVSGQGALEENTYCVSSDRIYVKSSTFDKYPFVESIQTTDQRFLYGKNTHHLVIEDIDFRGGDCTAVVLFFAPSSDITLRRVVARQFWLDGFDFSTPDAGYAGPPNTNLKILDCTIDKTWTPAMNLEAAPGAAGNAPYGDGIVFVNAVDGAVVRGCSVTNMGHTGIGNTYNDATLRGSGTRNILIEQNVVTAGVSSYCRAVGFGGPANCSNIVIRRNYFSDQNIQSQLGGDSVYVYSNVFDGTRVSPVKRFATCITSTAGYSTGFGKPIPHVVRNLVFANNTLFNAETFLRTDGTPNDGYLGANNVFSNNLCVEWRLFPQVFGARDTVFRSTACFADTTYAAAWSWRNNGYWKATGDSVVLTVARLGRSVDSYTTAKLNARPGCSGNRREDPRFVGGPDGTPDRFALAPDSPYLAAGAPLRSLLPPGLAAIDFYGRPFADPPSIGAIQSGYPPDLDRAAAPSEGHRAASVEGAPPPTLAITLVRPNPASRDGAEVSFILGDGPARLDVHDVAGRRVESQDLATFGPGAHTVRVGAGLPPGYYWLRLRQGDRFVARRAIVIR